MKKLFFVLFAVSFLFSCVSNENNQETYQGTAPIIKRISPTGDTIILKEYETTTIKVQSVSLHPDNLSLMWIYNNTIIGYGNEITLTAGENDGGKTGNLILEAKDGETFTTLSYTVEVEEINNGPTITYFSPINTDLQLEVYNSIGLSITADDPDGDSIKYKWYLNDTLQSCVINTFIFTADKELENSIVTIKVLIESSGGTVEKKWDIEIIHGDKAPQWNSNYSTIFLPKSNSSTNTLYPVFDIRSMVSDEDTYTSQLTFSIDSVSNDAVKVYLQNYMVGVTFSQNSYPFYTVFNVSDGEKSSKKTFQFIFDNYLYMKNENSHDISLFSINHGILISPYYNTDAGNIISSITTLNNKLYALTTAWGYNTNSYTIVQYNLYTLQKEQVYPIGNCASSPYSLVTANNKLYFSNLSPFEQNRDKLGIFYPETGTCNTLKIGELITDQTLGNEGITYDANNNMIFLAGTGLQSNWTTKDSYVTVVSCGTMDSYSFKVTKSCINMQNLSVKDNTLYLSCDNVYSTTYYSYLTGTVEKYDISNLSKGIKFLRELKLGIGAAPGKITVNPNNNEIIVGSTSSKGYVINGTDLTLTDTLSFISYGYGSLNPIITNNGIFNYILHPWGKDSYLFINNNLNNNWDAVYSLGDYGTSDGISK